MFLYDSRDEFYKSPYGAVCSGADVLLRVRYDGDIPPAVVALYEFDGERRETVTMKREAEGSHTFIAVITTAGYTGLIWYYFEYYEGGQKRYFAPRNGFSGGLGHEYHFSPPSYRITVCGFESKSDYGRGITYQIFPDRFCRSRAPSYEDYPRRIIKENTGDTPEYRPNQNGKIMNNDFYGGDLRGIISKLDYLESLHVKTIYLNPIFEASENHRYNTADYTKVDPMLGSEEDFRELCGKAHARGMKVMLDGVFSHTGSDSVYFNEYKNYGDGGAYNDKNSPFFEWYSFHEWPDNYSCWWNILTLPQTNENNEKYRDFIINGKDSVIRRWMRAGADGWRLDVADELPDDFIALLCKTAKEENPDSTVIGEVWEDASDKISYGVRRRYLTEDGLDGVMNYVFRDNLLAFILYGNAANFAEKIESLRENYPKTAFYNLMNSLGTHDTMRIITELGCGGNAYNLPRHEMAQHKLDGESRARAASMLKLAVTVQMCFPGSPCIYYGDEAGLEGFGDPFNRRFFPWGGEDTDLLNFYRHMTTARSTCEELMSGDIRFTHADGDLLVFTRTGKTHITTVAVNRGGNTQKTSSVTLGECSVIYGSLHQSPAGICIPPLSALVWRKRIEDSAPSL